MVIKTKNLIKVIKKKLGKKPLTLEITSGRHVKYSIFYQGTKVARTWFSHSSPEITGNLLSAIMNQLNLSKNEMEDFISCPLTTEDYVELIKSNEL